MNVKKLTSLILALSMMILICGYGGNDTSVIMDTINNHVYEYNSAKEILTTFANDAEVATKKYKNGYYVVTGIIDNISKKGDSIRVVSVLGSEDYIKCSCPKMLRDDAIKYKVGDKIGIFGMVTVDRIDKEIHIKVDRLVFETIAIKSGTYFLLDGTSIDKNSMKTRTLNDGAVKYYIPAEWQNVELSIEGDDIGTIEGYQYVLNKIPNSKDNTPESLFVCYFDNKSKLANIDDKKETELIEKAIVNNISGEYASSRNVTTYYGMKYNYFLGTYTDELNSKKNGYHVEYIFQKDGEEGFVMYLYVYKNSKHLKDIMFVTRFLEHTK